jgi:hypothetical protein
MVSEPPIWACDASYKSLPDVANCRDGENPSASAGFTFAEICLASALENPSALISQRIAMQRAMPRTPSLPHSVIDPEIFSMPQPEFGL